MDKHLLIQSIQERFQSIIKSVKTKDGELVSFPAVHFALPEYLNFNTEQLV